MASHVIVPEWFIRPSAFGAVQEDQTKAQMGDTQHVAGPKTAPLDAPAVDPGSVGAAQVANEKLAACNSQAAVAAGYSRRVEANFACPIASDQCQRAIKVKGCGSVQSDKTREHRVGP